jgi:hypothetical protein
MLSSSTSFASLPRVTSYKGSERTLRASSSTSDSAVFVLSTSLLTVTPMGSRTVGSQTNIVCDTKMARNILTPSCTSFLQLHFILQIVYGSFDSLEFGVDAGAVDGSKRSVRSPSPSLISLSLSLSIPPCAVILILIFQVKARCWTVPESSTSFA